MEDLRYCLNSIAQNTAFHCIISYLLRLKMNMLASTNVWIIDKRDKIGLMTEFWSSFKPEYLLGTNAKSSAEDHTEQTLIEMNNCVINSDKTIHFVCAHRVG